MHKYYIIDGLIPKYYYSRKIFVFLNYKINSCNFLILKEGYKQYTVSINANLHTITVDNT